MHEQMSEAEDGGTWKCRTRKQGPENEEQDISTEPMLKLSSAAVISTTITILYNSDIVIYGHVNPCYNWPLVQSHSVGMPKWICYSTV